MALEADGPIWRVSPPLEGWYRFCSNSQFEACNWLVEADRPEAFCRACRHNGTVPNLQVPANLAAWRLIESAKHRLFYTLLKLNVPLLTRAEDPEHGLVFEFLADPSSPDGPKVMTGHDNGRITIALVEAQDAEREKRRTAMGEPYRTLVGHFRHEIGHHYWDLLVRDKERLTACRRVFGDDREDYGAALKRHHDGGPPSNWGERFISAYATAHPWEDFAETWAHYLHIVDTIEMAASFNVRLNPEIDASGLFRAEFDLDPYAALNFGQLIELWLPLTSALNSINRCMGRPDLYPFIIPPPVIQKLAFIHDLLHDQL